MVINSHRKCVHFHQAVIEKYFAHVIMQAKNTKGASQKIGPVIMGVKANKVCAIEPLENLLSPFTRQKTENLVRRKWNVQEKTNLGIRHFFAEHCRQQHQV